MSFDPIAAIEAAYRMELDDHQWLLGICAEIASLVGAEQPVMAILVDPRGREPIAKAMVNPSRAAEVAGALFREALLGDPENRQRRFRLGPLTSLRRTAAGTSMSETLASAGIADSFFLLAGDPENSLCVVAMPRSSPGALPRERKYALVRIAAHVASAARLRSQAATAPIAAEAILTPDGRVEHAEPAVAESRGLAVLRAAALAAERARGKIRKSTPEKAVDLWRALVDGRWSLVDTFDHDGKRFLLARRNEPRAAVLHSLTERETYIGSLVARGHSSKLIAYQLGLSISTVATHLARLMAKLGVHSRAELAPMFGPSDGMPGPDRSKK